MKKSGTAPEIIIPLQLKRWSGKSPVLGVYGSEAGMRERDACLRNKLAKLRRCALRKPGIWVKKVWAQITNPCHQPLTKLDFHVDGDVEVDVYVDIDVGHHFHLHVGHIVRLNVGYLVHLQVGHHNVISTLCEGSETLLEWKSESITDQPTY